MLLSDFYFILRIYYTVDKDKIKYLTDVTNSDLWEQKY